MLAKEAEAAFIIGVWVGKSTDGDEGYCIIAIVTHLAHRIGIEHGLSIHQEQILVVSVGTQPLKSPTSETLLASGARQKKLTWWSGRFPACPRGGAVGLGRGGGVFMRQ